MFFDFLLDHIINPATFHLYRELFNLGFFRLFIYSCSQPYKITSFHSDHWYNGTMVPAQCFVHDLIRFVSSLSSGSFPPLFVSSSPLLRLLSSSLLLLFSGFFPPTPLLSCPPLILSSSSPTPFFFSSRSSPLQ